MKFSDYGRSNPMMAEGRENITETNQAPESLPVSEPRKAKFFVTNPTMWGTMEKLGSSESYTFYLGMYKIHVYCSWGVWKKIKPI